MAEIGRSTAAGEAVLDGDVRVYFAGQALAGMWACHEFVSGIMDAVKTRDGVRTIMAEFAVRQADAMLIALNEPGLRDRLANEAHALAMNEECDVSAIAPEHKTGFVAGHKAARHAIAEKVQAMLAGERMDGAA